MSAPVKRNFSSALDKNSDLSINIHGDDVDQQEVAKKKKADQSACHPQWNSLDAFKFVKVLKDDAQTKTLCVHAVVRKHTVKHADTDTHVEKDQSSVAASGDGNSGSPVASCEDGNGFNDDSSVNEGADAVIVMEKSAFDTSDLSIAKLFSGDTTVKQVFNNDIYGIYESLPPSNLNTLKTVIIYPATAKHLEKYQKHDGDIIMETADDYQNITLPWILSSSFEMQWIYNILEKKKESEFIIYEDADPVNGYILLPDLKWDRKSVDNLYLSAIIHRHGVKSLRDLTPEHLPLLQNIQRTALKAIEDKYGIRGSRIRAYFHYQPSYYHLHVHFNQIKYFAPGSNVLGAHLLTDVIANIELQSDYYQKKTLAFVSQENALLYKCYADADRIGKV